ncbi:hypothetical protein RhiirA4_482565 [Rhizophagus irregularis]|uniref:Uncharacterized protein n=1 Tax=Rhizophagus irregularis TaxID=588596 RepID=A0A2I1HL77_9GLOM|nr:hypothetical protein RhiirA4_482565 [Rhizophagus irregularis]
MDIFRKCRMITGRHAGFLETNPDLDVWLGRRTLENESGLGNQIKEAIEINEKLYPPTVQLPLSLTNSNLSYTTHLQAVDKLNPGLNHEPLNVKEKEFIVQWIENNLGPNDEINWKSLICDMEVKFDTLCPNALPKNYWYSLKRNLLSKMFHHENLTHLQILSLLAK